MREVAKGRFKMGLGAQEHFVTLNQPFYMDIYPVTQSLWESIMGKNLSSFKHEANPVEMVSWLDCILFCNKLSVWEGLPKAYHTPQNFEEMVSRQVDPYDEHLNKVSALITQNRNCTGYRLPTEAEWTYAATANSKYKYSGGNDISGVAWYKSNSEKRTQTVGRFHPNNFGLYDMSGNVHEWCWDWEADLQNWDRTDPAGPSRGTQRLLKGGSWRNRETELLITSRRAGDPASRRKYGGLRICKSILNQ
jgi:formylglycine-generating enzyme required for sulfatase activity